MHTTLNAIKEKNPCIDGWKKLLSHLNKTKADDEPLHLSVILKSNGINDAIWSLRAVDGKEKEIRLMAADFAEFSLHIFEKNYPTDERPRNAINAARDYANGLITINEMLAASDAAMDAARAAARAAASAAAWDAAMDAAMDAARAAARAAASAAAWDAAMDAAWAAAIAAAWENVTNIFVKYINQ